MDHHEEEYQNEDLSAGGVYPEPDFHPHYPWLGEAIHKAVPLVHEGFLPQDPESLNDDGQDAASPSSARTFSSPGIGESKHCYDTRSREKRHAIESSVDPDFVTQDNSVVSDEFISGADSDSQSYFLPMKAAVLTRRGKGGRGRGARGRERKGRGGHSGRGGKRGPRKPLEPSHEFKILHSQATMAFIDHNYGKAEDLAQQAIQVNPEMFPAHSLLSEIHMARGDKDKALTALFHGAHTRPRDTQMWFNIAELILERAGEDRVSGIRDAIYCYSRVIGVDPTHIEGRIRRAALNCELGHKGRAAYEYELLLKYTPHDLTVLRSLAEIYTDLDEVQRAIRHYNESVAHYQSQEPLVVTAFTWSDLNIYAELFNYSAQYENGIMKLKSVSRWLLGRGEDEFWDSYYEDDREWDADDVPRRDETSQFCPGKHDSGTYGFGLPLELRIKLGIFRLKSEEKNLDEAMKHFQWLKSGGDYKETTLYDYPDLFRDAADSLHLEGYCLQALQFYEPLRSLGDHMDALFWINMASCYRALKMDARAQECYRLMSENGEHHSETSFQASYIAEKNLSHDEPASVQKSSSLSISKILAPVPPRSSEKRLKLDKDPQKKARQEKFQEMHIRMRGLEEQIGVGNEDLESEWMEAAQFLVHDFRQNKVFFPPDKYLRFSGYPKEGRIKSLKSKETQLTEELGDTTGRLHSLLEGGDGFIRHDYQGIDFDDWLHIFLQYAVLLADNNNTQSAYETISLAAAANVFYHSPEAMFLIHVCWFSCALKNNDAEALCTVSRWFMKEFQFVTDSYRLYTLLNRFCDTPNSVFNSGPSQKFILRQVKAMDFSLRDDAGERKFFEERVSFTTKDKHGKSIRAEAMDIGLLMLYGHILYAGASYSYALNYFHRAYALDPTNPMITLSLALGYIHYALKRQSENRHYLIVQGLAFLFAYYDARMKSKIVSQRQEAEYNVGRTYHLLGLTHLSIPYYERCLAISEEAQRSSKDTKQDFVAEAAIALQGFLALSGKADVAQTITERWLVI